MVEQIEITSTSRDSATVSPLVLRSTDRRRLVFKPLLVNNIHDETASVKGTFIYQVKKQSDEWEDIDTVSLSRLKAGDEFKLELSSGEVVALFNRIYELYHYHDNNGIAMGTEKLVSVDSNVAVETVEQILNALPEAEGVEAFLEWLDNRDVDATSDAFRSVSTDRLDHISAALGVARLRNFVEKAKANLFNSDESFWQQLFKENSWVLGQVYPYPVVIIRDQAYMGGKSIASSGGNVADFLYRNSLTDNALIVEIKTPTASLTSAEKYRNKAHSCTKEVAGSVQQVLQDLYALRQNYGGLIADEDPEFRIFSPRCLVVIGNLANEQGADRRRSFELFRNNQREVDIVTFDELVAKAEILLDLFLVEESPGGYSEPSFDW